MWSRARSIATVEGMSDASPEQSPETGPIAVGGSLARPARTYTTGLVTRTLRRVAVGIMAATILATLVSYPHLPEEIPVHFGITGQADGWGPRWSVFLVLGIGAAIICGVAWVSRHPAWFNYLAVITESNAQEQYRNGEQMMVGVLLASSVLFAGIPLSTIANLNFGWLIAAAGIGMVASVVVGIARMIRLP